MKLDPGASASARAPHRMTRRASGENGGREVLGEQESVDAAHERSLSASALRSAR